MYYQLTNGRLVTVENMRIAYEIVTGEHFDPDSIEVVQRYDAWLKSNPNVINRFIHNTDNLSIEHLVLNGRILDATVRY